MQRCEQGNTPITSLVNFRAVAWLKIGMDVSGEFVISLILQKFEAMDRSALQPCVISSDGPVLELHVTAQFYLESKGKYILEVWEWANPKDTKRREVTGPTLAPLFIWFFFFFPSSPSTCPMQIGLVRKAVCFTKVLTLVLGPSFILFSQDFPFFVF